MGKKQHQKDKLYLTTTEWKETFGGCKDETILKAQQAKFKRLPFDCCCISLQPFEYPACSTDGHIFDITNIVPFLKKYGKNPVTGEKLDPKSLVTLNFHKNNDGEYHCPATYRVFTNTSHIVAVRQTGNVYSYEAIDELNFKPKNFRDLLTDESFTRKDIITIQDPHHLDKFNIANFYHVKKKLKFEKEDKNGQDKEAGGSGTSNIKRMNTETRETLSQLEKDYKPLEKTIENKPKADRVNAAHFSTGAVAASFTSTVMDPVTKHEAAIVEESVLIYRRVNKKGYIRLVTNYGHLNLELHCDLTPKTCDNFVRHCRSGYYKQTKFHRSIKNFMIQGGDPSGTGTGGESAFVGGKPFEDEFKPQLSHEGRGILCMANRGTNTNTSQFYITFRSCKHLDKKHTVFGRLVGGFETLSIIERIPTDDKDKPTADIIILETQVFVDPYEEAAEQLTKEREQTTTDSSASADSKNNTAADDSAATAGPVKFVAYKDGIGKYVKNPPGLSASKKKDGGGSSKSSLLQQAVEEPVTKKRKVSTVEFKNFSNW